MSPESNQRGIGLSGFVFCIFLFLKLAEIGVVATWSWWWVTSPLWIPLAFVGLLLGIILSIAGLGALFSASAAKKAAREWHKKRR
jgi:hypothetical protein